jgi:preprotein translocase subunit SecG
MEHIVLVIHLILAVTIVVLVLIQRSSGGGLGIGGGSGGLGDFATARGAASALSKTTTICALMFFVTSLTLAYMGKGAIHSGGLLDKYSTETVAPAVPAADQPATDAAPAAPAAQTPEPPVSTE